MLKLNPHAKATKRAAILAQERSKASRGKVVDKKRKATAGKKWKIMRMIVSWSNQINNALVKRRSQHVITFSGLPFSQPIFSLVTGDLSLVTCWLAQITDAAFFCGFFFSKIGINSVHPCWYESIMDNPAMIKLFSVEVQYGSPLLGPVSLQEQSEWSTEDLRCLVESQTGQHYSYMWLG